MEYIAKDIFVIQRPFLLYHLMYRKLLYTITSVSHAKGQQVLKRVRIYRSPPYHRNRINSCQRPFQKSELGLSDWFILKSGTS